VKIEASQAVNLLSARGVCMIAMTFSREVFPRAIAVGVPSILSQIQRDIEELDEQT